MDRETRQLKDFRDCLVGQPLDEAIDMCKSLCPWMVIRVMRVDGKNCVGTCDVNPDRANVAVKNGIITSIIGIG